MNSIDLFDRNLSRLKKVDGNLDLTEARLIYYLKQIKGQEGFEERVEKYKSFLMLNAGEKLANVIIIPIIQIVVLVLSAIPILVFSSDVKTIYLMPYISAAAALIQIILYFFFISTIVSAGKYLKEFGKCFQI
jgi:hypothetical protein